MNPTRRVFLQGVTGLGALSVFALNANTISGQSEEPAADDSSIPVPEPRIACFETLAYGMFIHWGLYSLLGKGEWIQSHMKIPNSEYQKLKDTFTAQDFDGKTFARTARKAGMKYITLTTRHHEGFSLYDTCGLSDYDAPHSAAGRDLVKDFVEGCRAEDIVPFFYHTTLDWHQDSFKNDFNAYLQYLRDSVRLLCTNYGEIGGLWFDGNWSKPKADWQLDKLYSMIRQLQPQAMIIDNTGMHQRGKIGHSEIDSTTFERGRPTPMDRRGMKKYIAAEMCQTTNNHWGFAQNDFCYASAGDIIENLCACRKVGANFLLNVGPTATGKLPDYEKALFERIGDWIQMHAEPVYNGKPSGIKGTDSDFALETGDKIYLFIHNLFIRGDKNVTLQREGAGPRIFEDVRRKIQSAKWMDNGEELKFQQDSAENKLTVE
ncbi:MAG: alpha-L-fucosidase, partial [Sedimentisphaerales bacterium]|nr:alpha-L-fucosidase [Sedimentisphaerales bacterium]